ncbi:hypothetical protein ACLOJK_030725 [Asimina triloba]
MQMSSGFGIGNDYPAGIDEQHLKHLLSLFKCCLIVLLTGAWQLESSSLVKPKAGEFILTIRGPPKRINEAIWQALKELKSKAFHKRAFGGSGLEKNG